MLFYSFGLVILEITILPFNTLFLSVFDNVSVPIYLLVAFTFDIFFEAKCTDSMIETFESKNGKNYRKDYDNCYD